MMTMTVQEARQIVNEISAALQTQQTPEAAADRSRKRIDRRIVKKILDSPLRRMLPRAIKHQLRNFAFDLGDRAKERAIKASSISRYKPWQINAAFKIGIADIFIDLARGKISEQEFLEFVNAASPWTLALAGFIQIVDPSTQEMHPEWANNEASASFAEFCRHLRADDRQYWSKIYARIGLESQEDSKLVS